MLTNMSKPVCTMSLCNIIPDLDLMSAEITRIIRQIITKLCLPDYADGAQSGFSIIGGQKIDRYSIYVDRKRSLAKEWDLGYGMSYRFAKDRDFQTYDKVTGDIPTENTDSRLREQTANVYVSLSKNYATGTSVSISATGEYYTIGNYRKWAVYPQASLTYVKSSEHLFQFSLSTDKTYPGYWDMQSSVSHLNGYTELWGTPGLKPSTAYNLNGNYIWKQKYIFGLFFMHTSDFFVQTGYQSTDRLALIYKNTNWNYMQMWGTNVILPFKAGNWLDSRLTLVGMQVHQRCDDFFDIPFNRRKWMFNSSLDNTFKIGKNLAFELIGSIQTPMIQGTFDIETVYNLTAGLKWSFASDRINLSARCSDLFNSGMPNLKVRFNGQHLDMNNDFIRALLPYISATASVDIRRKKPGRLIPQGSDISMSLVYLLGLCVECTCFRLYG